MESLVSPCIWGLIWSFLERQEFSENREFLRFPGKEAPGRQRTVHPTKGEERTRNKRETDSLGTGSDLGWSLR